MQTDAEILYVEIDADLMTKFLAEYEASGNGRTVDEFVSDYLTMGIRLAELARSHQWDTQRPLTMPLQDWQTHSNPKIGCV